jgi:hypothetical protein
VTPSGNSGHVVLPKAWIGGEAIVTLKEKENRTKGKKVTLQNKRAKDMTGYRYV